MTCLDCAAEHGTDRPAIAVCIHCGAGVCLPHARITSAPPAGLPPLLAPNTTAPASRQVHCLTCAASQAGADPATTPAHRTVHRHPNPARPRPPMNAPSPQGYCPKWRQGLATVPRRVTHKHWVARVDHHPSLEPQWPRPIARSVG